MLQRISVYKGGHPLLSHMNVKFYTIKSISGNVSLEVTGMQTLKGVWLLEFKTKLPLQFNITGNEDEKVHALHLSRFVFKSNSVGDK